jgi:hypothetical protein
MKSRKIILSSLCVIAMAITIIGIKACNEAKAGGPNEKETAFLSKLKSISHNISPKDADIMIQKFRRIVPDLLKSNVVSFIPESLTYNKNKIMEILSSEDCIGLRVYNALTEDNVVKVVLVGVNSDGKDILETGVYGSLINSIGLPATVLNNNTSSKIAEWGQCTPPCPKRPICCP